MRWTLMRSVLGSMVRAVLTSLVMGAIGVGGVLAVGGFAAGCKGSYDLDGGDLVTVGKAFVAQRKCAMCHESASGSASDGVLSGQSTALAGTMVYGTNLTPDHRTGIGDWADIQIVRAMRFGVGHDEMALCPQMPHFDGSDPKQPYMTDLEAGAIVAYLRSLPAITRLDGGIPASECRPPPDDLYMTPLDMTSMTSMPVNDGGKPNG